MSNSPLSKKIAIAVVVIVIVVVLFFVMKKSGNQAGSNMTANVAATTSETSPDAAQPVVPAVPVNPAVDQVKASGVSDSSLEQDAKSLDEQLSGLAADAKNAGVVNTTK
jgi:flagellar biosynthesis/type III secretory pathway M-ring protein FliF/YscJ